MLFEVDRCCHIRTIPRTARVSAASAPANIEMPTQKYLTTYRLSGSSAGEALSQWSLISDGGEQDASRALTNMGPDLALDQARISVSNRDEVPETRTPEVRLFHP